MVETRRYVAARMEECDGLQRRSVVDPLGLSTTTLACNFVFNVRLIYSRNSRSRRWLLQHPDAFPMGEAARHLISGREIKFSL